MFAFVRVFAFYVGMAALLTWALFALGWNEALELPGFEGTRSRPAVPTVQVATVRPEDPAGAAQPSRPQEPKSALELPPVTGPSIASTRETAAIGKMDLPPARPEPKAVEAAKPPTQALSPSAGAEPSLVVPPIKRIAPALPPLPAAAAAPPQVPIVATPLPAPAVAPTSTAAAPPQASSESVDRRAAYRSLPQGSPPVPRRIEAPPVPPAPPQPVASAPAQPAADPPPRQPSVAPAATPRRPAPRWAPQRRIAGFGADDLLSSLEDARLAPDDVPCIVFEDIAFVPGTPRPLPKVSQQIDLIARVLDAVAVYRIEIGSRLGPGRPMKSDAKLRVDRVRVVRDALIRHGVPAARLFADPDNLFERTADDIRQRSGRRIQSMGLCVHT